jgi:hypothetical protein
MLSSGQADVSMVDGLRAKIITGNPFSESCLVTERISEVKTLLGPLTRHDVPTTRCIGLNYAKHSTFIYFAV